MSKKQKFKILIFNKILSSKILSILIIGSLINIGSLKPVLAEPVYGYWKQYAETYRQRKENSKLEKKERCYESCDEVDVKHAIKNLRYTMPLDSYTSYSYSYNSYKNNGLSYDSHSSYIGHNSYTSPYQAYTQVFGESDYIHD